MKKTVRKRLVVLIIISLLFHMLLGGMAPAAGAAETNPQNPRIEGGVTEWDCVWFGTYPQSDATGATKDPIKWRVLSVNDDDAFLLADTNLDVQRYNDTDTDVTWETCTMRTWLNSTFLNKAFNESEQAAIKNTTVVNEDNPSYNTEGGETTEDKVYFLSISEAKNSSYGFTSTTSTTDTREAVNTAYVAAGGEISGGMPSAGSTGAWWLRSPGYYSYYASYVTVSGGVYQSGFGVYYSSIAVRPVLHLDLSSASSWSYAGTISSDGIEFEMPPVPPTPVPTATPTPTPTPTLAPTPTPTATPTPTPPAVSTPTPTPTPPAVPTPVVTPPSTQNPVTKPPVHTQNPTLPPVQTPNADTGAMEDPIVTQSPDITNAPVMTESPNNTAAPDNSVTPNSPNGGTGDKEKAETDKSDNGKTGKTSKTGNAERGKNDSEKNESGKSGNGKSGSKKGGGGTGSEPKTGDETHTGIYATVAMVAGCSYLLLYFADDTRGMTEEEKKRVLARLIRWAKQGGRIRRALAVPVIVMFLVWYHGIGKQCVEMGKGKESGLLKA